MKSIVFDSSAIISLINNNLLDTLKELKKLYKGEFFISEEIKKEIVDVPAKNRKYKLGALMLADYLADGYIKFLKKIKLDNKTKYLLHLANNMFIAQGSYIRIVSKAEIEGLALVLTLNSDAYVVDERTLRLLIEDPKSLLNLLERKLETKIELDKRNFRLFKEQVKDVQIIRTSELMVIAFELGLFNKYEDSKEFLKGNIRRQLLEGILWGLRLRGCAISTEEINDILKVERFK